MSTRFYASKLIGTVTSVESSQSQSCHSSIVVCIVSDSMGVGCSREESFKSLGLLLSRDSALFNDSSVSGTNEDGLVTARTVYVWVHRTGEWRVHLVC